MFSVTISANDALGVRFIRAALQPKRDNLARRNIMAGVTFVAGRINAIRRIHDVRRCSVVLIVTMGIRWPVTRHAAYFGSSVSAGQRLSLVVRVANKARAIVGEPLLLLRKKLGGRRYRRERIFRLARLIHK